MPALGCQPHRGGLTGWILKDDPISIRQNDGQNVTCRGNGGTKGTEARKSAPFRKLQAACTAQEQSGRQDNKETKSGDIRGPDCTESYLPFQEI